MSSPSCRDNSSATPSEVPAPRRSQLTTANPWATHQLGSGASQLVKVEKLTGLGWRITRYWNEKRERRRVRRGNRSLPYGCAHNSTGTGSSVTGR